jgi:uncharacterized membrane protein HdeD (DUF308 family)
LANFRSPYRLSIIKADVVVALKKLLFLEIRGGERLHLANCSLRSIARFPTNREEFSMSTIQADREAGAGLGSAMVHALAKNWWLLLLRGVAAIIFGLLTFAWPGLTLLTLILFYGAFALIDGVLAIIAAITGGAPAPRWWLAIVGLLGIGAGLLTFLMPGLTALVLLYFIAGWAIATGLFQIVGAIKLRKEIDNEWLLILGGIISVLFGVAMMLAPGAGALALVWVIGAYSVVIGVIFVALAFRLKKHTHS